MVERPVAPRRAIWRGLLHPRRGLQEHYGLDAKALQFCRTHEEADVQHGSLSEVIVRRYIVTPELEQQARAMVQRKLELQYDMWDTYRFF